jgi:hypothetical protein
MRDFVFWRNGGNGAAAQKVIALFNTVVTSGVAMPRDENFYSPCAPGWLTDLLGRLQCTLMFPVQSRRIS